jgi:hypothetical protein
VSILDKERLIEPERVTHFRDLAGSGAFTKHLFDRIAGNDVHEKKNQGEHQPERRKSEPEAMKEMADHSGGDLALLSLWLFF